MALCVARARPVAVLLLLTACQPLPHPLAGNAPKPGAPILTLRDTASVAIAPLAGTPRATAEKLGPAMAEALQKHDIAASNRTASLDSYHLLGRIQEMPPVGGRTALVASWRLNDPSGKLVGVRAQRMEAAPGDWQTGNEDVVARLAAAGAKEVAALMEDKAPIEAEQGGRTRLRIGGVKGAPGDGGTALETAITTLLKRQDLAIVSDPHDQADLVLDALVKVAAAKAGKQDVKIVWRVRRPDGSEIGTVGQENNVPTGLLDGAWGDVAYVVAVSAQDGIMALVARGAPAEPAGKS
jgi:hypothetical protein